MGECMSLFNNLLGNGLPVWLFVSAFFVFAFDLVKSKFWANCQCENLKRDLKPFIVLSLFFAVILVLSPILHLTMANQWLYLSLGLVLTYLSGSMSAEKNKSMPATFLLAAAALLTTLKPDNFFEVSCAFLLGMTAWKVVFNMLHPKEARLDDIAPAFAYLAAMLLDANVGSNFSIGKQEDIITSSFIVGTLLNLMQRPFMFNDRILVKRVVLTLAGGLTMLVLLTKAANAADFSKLAALVGAGFGAMYALDAMGQACKGELGINVNKAMKQVLVIGIFTLLATRLFGNMGLAALSGCLLVGRFTQVPAFAGMFFASRALEQVFANGSIANVTGVNLQHSYVSAAQYLAFFLVLSLIMMMRDARNSKLDACLLMLAGTLGAASINYFLHGEATGSFLISLGVSATIAGLLLQPYFVEEENRLLSIILVPALAGVSSLFAKELVELGYNAAMNDRLTVLGVLAALAALVLAGSHFASGKKSTGNGVAVSAD